MYTKLAHIKGDEMSDEKYNEADLLWEATRRNVEYRNDFLAMLEKYRADSRHKEIENPGYLPYISSDRWSILMVKEDDDRIRVFGWLDPSIEIDEIKKEIRSGAVPVSVHPYAYIHELKRTNPNIYYHHDSKQDRNEYFTEHTINDSTYVCIKKGIIRNRVLVLIDPTASDKTIIDTVKDIKEEVLKAIRNKTDELKKMGEVVCYPRDIPQYIDYLKKYDYVVDYFSKTGPADKLSADGGASLVPKDFSFRDVVPKDIEGEQFEGTRRAYKKAYEQSIKMIQVSPNIHFSPSRSKK